MSQEAAENTGNGEKQRKGAGRRVRGLVLGLAFFAAGAVSAWWFLRPAPESTGPYPLSDATKAVLQHLDSPVELRFYSLLDSNSVGEIGQAFSARVDQLLSQYEQEAGGKLKVTRVTSISDAAYTAAAHDGLKPFNLDKGDACFLGIAVVRGSQKQSLATLAQDWEPALESDLSRTIAGVDAASPKPFQPAKANVATIEAVKRALPNLDSVSVAQGKQMLRAASLAQFEKTAKEMQARVKQAEERFLQAQGSHSDAEQAAALKDLKQLQKDQSARLKEIVFESKAQLEALQQLKDPAH